MPNVPSPSAAARELAAQRMLTAMPTANGSPNGGSISIAKPVCRRPGGGNSGPPDLSAPCRSFDSAAPQPSAGKLEMPATRRPGQQAPPPSGNPYTIFSEQPGVMGYGADPRSLPPPAPFPAPLGAPPSRQASQWDGRG